MSEWQPIATAPKDGTPVILWNGVWVGEGYHEIRPYWVWQSEDAVNPPPTHWMPLPEPPKDV